jgi:hypothetical protein
VIKRYVETPPTDTNAPGAFRFAELGKLADILSEAGASDVHERLLKFRIEAPISPHEFWLMRSETSETLRRQLARLNPEQALRLTSEVEESLLEFFLNNQMSLPAQMIIITGTKHNDI